METEIILIQIGKPSHMMTHRCILNFPFGQAAAAITLLTHGHPDLDDQADYNTIMQYKLEAGHTLPFDQCFGKDSRWTVAPPGPDTAFGPSHHHDLTQVATLRYSESLPPTTTTPCALYTDQPPHV
jgi:hypothetical protein